MANLTQKDIFLVDVNQVSHLNPIKVQTVKIKKEVGNQVGLISRWPVYLTMMLCKIST